MKWKLIGIVLLISALSLSIKFLGRYYLEQKPENIAGRAADVREESAQPGKDYLAGVEQREREGDFANAAATLQKMIEDQPGDPLVSKAQEKLGAINIKLLFSREITPGSEEYVVKRGDSLDAIAGKYGTTVDLIREANRGIIKNDAIRPNDRLKVCVEPFSIIVDKSANTLTLKQGERLVKVYQVGTGKNNSTPIGGFKIINKMANPEWFKPGGGVIAFGDPGNLLGTRWMGIDSPGYGIHGTWEPETIGKQASMGCIRMLNQDVEELFRIVPLGTKVIIVE